MKKQYCMPLIEVNSIASSTLMTTSGAEGYKASANIGSGGVYTPLEDGGGGLISGAL